MEKSYVQNRTRAHRMKRKRRRLLFIILICMVLMIIKLFDIFSSKPQPVKTIEYAEKIESVSTDKLNNKSKGSESSLQNVSDVEDAAFVEKYLNQQMQGQRPEGIDGKKVVYLSFDDGPSVTVTPKILDILKKESVKATFFVVGKAVEENEVTKKITKRLVKEGHAIGNHTYSHDYSYLYPNQTVNSSSFMNDIEKTNQVLKQILGQNFSTRAIRFPGGHMTWQRNDPDGMEVLDKELQDKDYHQIDWNVLPKDAEGARKNAEQLISEFMRNIGTREKAVVLMHDTYGKEETAKALPEIIRYLKKQGYEFKTIK
ncbi:peptidoglycan/xylan/chitin deacetylase (PgdA/CDA1 family) [Paenibacillus sp. 1182]|uniref:polysaccharide deacetylase family protein n=1 Tax=Paenibacillus sp. 1182 TaxID=2806565 RepID=UPI000F9EA0DD|nr:polysaccharide deacetylase family protein [Paenibacillus sp. 1182]MBP1312627.1 peptidoglycan/xylan/chitin deacetylase (PgdA/CDA1 family) [Paenibacillus sp. 1182]